MSEKEGSSAPYIVFGKPYIGEEEIEEVVASIRAGWLGTGPKVQKFTEGFRDYIGAEHAAAVHSCTAGLFLSQVALGIGDGDAVITTPMTFVATAHSIRHTGAEPLFADVHPTNGLLDPEDVARVLAEDCDIDDADGRPLHRATGRKVRALMPVHMWGQAADIDAFQALCDKYNLYMIEDCAHAIETTYKDRKVGTTADLSCFSFYATKNLCTGEGGMVTTANEELADKIKTLSLHGLSRGAWSRFSSSGYQHYLALETGYKFNMMDLQAGLGIHQLARLEKMYEERTRQWHAYREDLADVPGIEIPEAEAPDGRHARHLFVIRITEDCPVVRDDFLNALHAKGVGSGVHYLSVSEHPAYKDCFHTPVPNSEKLGRSILSIPLAGAMEEDGRKRVVAAVREVATGQ